MKCHVTNIERNIDSVHVVLIYIEIHLLRKHFPSVITYARALYHILSVNVSVCSASNGPVCKIDPTQIIDLGRVYI